jgi:hypothetical protein
MVFTAGALFLLLAWAAPAVYADQTVLSDKQYQMSGKDIIVHIIEVNVVDVPKSNIMPQPDSQYYQIIYSFENTGDSKDKGFIQPVLIGSDNSQYQNSEYTGQNVLPRTTAGPFFVEIPVPLNTEIVKLVFVEGFEQHEFDLRQATSSPTPGPSATSAASPTPAPGSYRWGDCLPLIPFAMAGGIAGMGIVINRCGFRNR